jgi:flagellin-like protein
MKGVSTVIATVLMLVITIALAGMAYTIMSGWLTAQTSKAIEVTDVGCRALVTPNGYYVSIKNLDPSANITISSDLTARVDSVPYNLATCTGSIAASSTVNCDIAAVGGNGGTLHKVRIIGPANAVEKSAAC